MAKVVGNPFANMMGNKAPKGKGGASKPAKKNPFAAKSNGKNAIAPATVYPKGSAKKA